MPMDWWYEKLLENYLKTGLTVTVRPTPFLLAPGRCTATIHIANETTAAGVAAFEGLHYSRDSSGRAKWHWWFDFRCC